MRVSPAMLVALAGVAVAACNTGHAGLLAEGDDGGPSGDAEGGPPPDLNPDGIPYPTPPGGHFGQMARTGNTPGSVIQDFVFQGYPGGVIAPMLSQIKLSSF